MFNTKKAPSYIQLLLSEEEKRGEFCLICKKGKRNLSFEDLREDWTGKLVCVESKNSLVTSNGWLHTEIEGTPRKAYLTVKYPTEHGEKRKIFMLDSCF